MTVRATIALLLAALFLMVAMAGGPSGGWDAATAEWFGQLRTKFPGIMQWAAFLTVIGGAPVTLILALFAALWLLAKRLRGRALLLATTVLLERLAVELMKGAFGRPRPEVEHLPSSFAFPSGHAANSLTTYLAIALIAVPDRYRRPAALTALFISAVVGLTRLVLGVHWASDVIGGWTFGLLAVGLAVTIGERSATLRLKAQHDVVARHRLPASEDESA